MPGYDDNPQRVSTRLQRMLATKRGQAISGDGDATQVIRKVEQRYVRGAAFTVTAPRKSEGIPD